MINAIKTSPISSALSLRKQEDPSLYGTLSVIAACLGTMLALIVLG